MTKYVLVLHDGPRDRATRRAVLVDQRAPAWVRAGAAKLSVIVADAAADVPGPNPFVTRGLPVALVNLWTDDAALLAQVIAEVRAEGFAVAGYAVEESVPTDYGDNVHAAARDWPDGTRSPGVTAVSLLERPASLSPDVWLARWHGRMSPVSGEIQPRTRYVRNLVVSAVTEGAHPWAGIVEEVWPSPRHVSNPFLFYGASNPLSLVVNMVRILAAVQNFTRPWRVKTFMASEWFIRS